ncbi:hypothetical protein An16g05100 [Aspergillus niger]|uniref:Uncharacterized protein n=2 Tax=Aspergillus niger TaxID=5061 RepID=A2R7X6_ASPNC|nr:hypothetical protein An16g05100 [Aspergillus niger]CAK97364.1 hypothetical protein An16g05100 [Aspergillus niger]
MDVRSSPQSTHHIDGWSNQIDSDEVGTTYYLITYWVLNSYRNDSGKTSSDESCYFLLCFGWYQKAQKPGSLLLERPIFLP